MNSPINLKPLVNAVQAVQDAQVALMRQQAVMQDSIAQVAATGDQTQNDLQSLSARFDEFTRREELRHNLQVAHTEIVQVRQQLAAEFGHFGDVRRLATGTLQALDSGIVSQASIRQLSEELMLLTPRYWLAPALVALAAWIRNDPDLAYRALNEAVRRDNDKAALFFAMVLRRHQRDEAAVRWIRQYVVRQDPANLSREFMVVLDAVSCGVFGVAAKPLVLTETSEWISRLSDDQATVDRQVTRWQEELDALRRPVDPRYQILPAISPTWPQLKELYEGATVHQAALEMFQGVFTGPVPLEAGLRDRVDNILDGLVTNYDIEEAPLRLREAGLQAIIDALGDRTAADKAMRTREALHETTVDFLTLISNAALYPEQAGASLGTRRFATALAKDWIVQAAGRLEARNVASVPRSVAVAIEGWQAEVDNNTNQEDLARDLARHIDTETERAVAQVRFVGKPLGASIGAGVCLVIALTSALGGSTGAGVFFLLAALGLALWTFQMARGLPARRAELRRQGEQRKAVAVSQLYGGIAELVDLNKEWQQACASAGVLREYVESLQSRGFIADSPDQRRGM
ncbi:hypothetical protein [Actinocrispum wychmicini]|uniref:Uncharacterized protein n=1 Tax=Actinocrispum wychmicini TaxID=1213861 RepID=A0A4R2JIL1_9PSEU|nr:hypothetical protein [Actinocrispum wychmicini]TCO59753.1 hypothetical protein EV192_104596 [Actinocrispum wychmicini]